MKHYLVNYMNNMESYMKRNYLTLKEKLYFKKMTNSILIRSMLLANYILNEVPQEKKKSNHMDYGKETINNY